MGKCPEPNKPVDNPSDSAIIQTPAPEAAAGTVAGAPAIAPQIAANAAPAPAPGVREAMEAAARGSWQWAALEALEDLRGRIVQDAPAELLANLRALRDAIREDVVGISPDVLPYPEDEPPPTWKQGARDFPNTWEGRPNWKAEALHAAQGVIDAIDVDASSGVYNAWGLFKEALHKAKAPAG